MERMVAAAAGSTPLLRSEADLEARGALWIGVLFQRPGLAALAGVRLDRDRYDRARADCDGPDRSPPLRAAVAGRDRCRASAFDAVSCPLSTGAANVRDDAHAGRSRAVLGAMARLADAESACALQRNGERRECRPGALAFPGRHSAAAHCSGNPCFAAA